MTEQPSVLLEPHPVPALDAESISFGYRSDLVLRDVSCSIHPGEFVGVIGPNGSGKSTLLRILSGVMSPNSGTVRLDGIPIREIPRRDVAKSIAVVPQETTFTFAFSALEVVLMGRSPHLGRFTLEGVSDLDMAREVMESTDTWHLRDRKMDELSGGEKQRVVISRALAQEPSILLLDEPTTALDIRHQVDIYRLLNRLHAEAGHTVMLVLHDLNLAAKVCDRLILLHEGQVQMDGTPNQVIRSELLSDVYETDLRVEIDSHSGTPVVIVPI
jgi:iron complex transport system ATP-binding protein